MAIFGNFRDLPLADVLAMLGRRSGVLEVFLSPRARSYLIALDMGKVLWVKHGNRALDPLAARSALRELLGSTQGAFEFIPGRPAPEGTPLGWPLEHVLLYITTFEDERRAYNGQLPDPRTRFQAVSLEVSLEDPLRSFWERARDHLKAGASAEELARKLGLHLDDVRYYLHKLRLLGKVTPVRAYLDRKASGEDTNLFRQLLRALLGRRG